MQRIVLLVLLIIVLVACSSGAPSEVDIQTAIAQTAEAAPIETPVPTDAPKPTEEPTATSEPTNTPMPTDTPEPTATPEPLWPVPSVSDLSGNDYFKDDVTGIVVALKLVDWENMSGREDELRGTELTSFVNPLGYMTAALRLEPSNGTYEQELWWEGRFRGIGYLGIDEIIINADGEVYRFPVYNRPHKETITGKFEEEQVVIHPNKLDDETIHQILSSEEVLVRLNGEKLTYDFELSAKERTSLEQMAGLSYSIKNGSVSINEDAPPGKLQSGDILDITKTDG